MFTKLPVAVAATTLLCSGVAAAESFISPPRAVGVSLNASILMGLGISVGVPVGDRFNVRGVYNGFSYDDEFEDDEDNLTYDAELKLSSLGLMGDWHPFRGAFRVTAGLLSNGNELDLNAQDAGGTFEVGDCTYASGAGAPLAIDGLIDWRSSAPYLGIGWGGNMNADKGFFGTFDIGVMFSGAPKAKLAGSGTAQVVAGSAPQCGAGGFTVGDGSPQDQVFQDELRTAENDANEEADDFKLWPNISFGFGWRF